MKTVAKKTKAQKINSFKKNAPLFFIASFGLIYLLVNNYIPMMGVFIAFKKIDFAKGIFASDWCGLKNFQFLFQTKDAFIMMRNTLLYNLVFIILGTVLAVFIALIMSEVVKRTCSKFFQAGLILPNLVSMVVVSYLVYSFLNPQSGLINNTILKPLGIESINWYNEPKFWPFILVFVQMWKTAGYSSIVYIASIAGMDSQIYEAARIDGAGKLKQIFTITIPMLKPTIIIMMLMSVGRIFATDFGLFYQVPMNSGALFNVTQTVDTYVYRALIQLGDVGMSAAAGLFQSVIGFALVMLANLIVRKFSADDALF